MFERRATLYLSVYFWLLILSALLKIECIQNTIMRDLAERDMELEFLRMNLGPLGGLGKN